MEDEKKYKNIVEQEYAFKRKKVLSLDIKMFIEFKWKVVPEFLDLQY